MTKSTIRRPSRPYVEGLENRVQPGSVITGGFDPSLLAGSFLSHGLLSVFDEPVAARVMMPTSAGVVNSVESEDITPPPFPRSDLNVSVTIPTNSVVSGLEVTLGLGAMRSAPSPTLGPGTVMGRPGDAGSRGPDLLFYGGDFLPDGTGLANEYNTYVSDARTYDDVRLRGAWKTDCLFSHNLMTFTGVQQAYVHVIGPGKFQEGVHNGGLADAYPRTLHPATQTFYSSGGYGLVEYEIKVCGLGLQLPHGHYYFNVQPVGFGGEGRSFGATTHGQNGKGSPLYNDDSWFHSPYFGAFWVDTEDYLSKGLKWDFSQGICSAPAC